LGIDKKTEIGYISGRFCSIPFPSEVHMTTATAPEPTTTPQFSLDNPPPGFKWDWDEVKGDHGQLSFGQRPILTALDGEEGGQGLLKFYGWDGIARIYNGTSGRVQFQGVDRRITQKGKKEGWDEDKINAICAEEQLKYRPGKRASGQSTAQSRAAAAAKKASGRIGGDAIASMIERVAKMSEEERNALAAQMGFDPSLFVLAQQPTPDDDEDEVVEEENGEEATS
jgi:hypothetical protein